ncbi:hypothetical protein COV18_05150 [Candidatus Woesearchaeota archaeon CG10_big_fil_rev_8_21_14_0_10_37_12]|nr:MAG: hypothetical protein COV18_05150 [Candidatus Woesearchaeota archaeon CG10_big_fil_rev_8_21_14_0_10_37_12]
MKHYVILLVLLLSCTQTVQESTIGILIPQTGKAAHLGEELLNGIQLAAKETGNQYKLIVEDDKCDPKTGVLATQKLLTVDDVDAILGPICTVSLLASAPYIEETQTPRITLGMVLQATAEAGDYHFSFLPEMNKQMTAITNYAVEKNYSSIAAIAIDDDLGRESIAELKQALDTNNIMFTAEEYYVNSLDTQETDFRTYLMKIANKDPEAIYILGYVPDSILLVKQAEELGINLPILTWNLYQDQNVIDQLGKLAERVVYTYPEDPKDLPRKIAFKQAYLAEYGEEPGLYAANAYDSYMLLAKALDTCGNHSECIKQKLYNIEGYEGANGYLSVDNRGIGQREEVSIKTARNGKFVTIN